MLLRTGELRSLLLALLLPLFLLGGCATTNPRDPLEPMNRAIYSFNDGVDNVIFKPLAEGYRAVLPSFVRTGISNFFSNINDVLVALNNLLQGKIVNALSDLGRIVVNSTVGVAGLFDVASPLGMEKHNEDFGQTLGAWGVGDGPYLVLPFLGPSNLRDALGRVVDAKADPLGYLHSVRLRNSLWGTRLVSQRAELLDTSKILETAALDPYEFLRDAYLQRRRNLIFDGSPPREKDDDASVKPQPLLPRTESPFPANAEADANLPGTPLPSGTVGESTPARAEAPDAAPAEALAPAAAEAPQAEVVLPAEPTAAGAAADATPPVLRVWVSAAE